MDNVIENSEFFDYRPPNSEDFNETGSEFSITVHNEDIVTLPSKSLLLINGLVTVKEKVTTNTTQSTQTSETTTTLTDINLDEFRFVNNGPLYFFDRIDYYVGDVKIDTIRKPGYATQMKGLASFENDLSFNNAGWKISNQSKNNILNTKGYFSASIPLSIIMGFFEDHKNFLYRMPQKLVFYRITGAPNNAFYQNTTKQLQYSVEIRDIVWRMPQIKFSIEYEARIRNEILKSTNYDLHYRHWFYHSIIPVSTTEFTWDLPVAYSKTKYLLLAFQTDVDNKIKSDNSQYTLANLENVQVLLNNNIYYPRERLNLKYSDYKCGNLYHMFRQFKSSYYDKNFEDTLPLIDYNTFLTKYPLIVIDCSHQPNVIKESLINVKIMFNWRENLPSLTTIHCLMIMDRKGTYNPLSNRVVAQS